MKKWILLSLIGILSWTFSDAQNMKDRETIRIESSVRCKADQDRIKHFFKTEQGILYLNVNYFKKVITVRYRPSRTTPANIRAAIANLGYDADSVKANPYYKKRLPPCPTKGGRKKS